MRVAYRIKLYSHVNSVFRNAKANNYVFLQIRERFLYIGFTLFLFTPYFILIPVNEM